MKLKFACHQQQSLRLKRFVSSSLALGILFNNILTPFNSFAGVLSDNARYEAFEGSNLVIDDILEDDKVDVEIGGNTVVNLLGDITNVSSGDVITIENDGRNISFVQNSVQDKIQKISFKNAIVEPGKIYTLYFEIVKNTLSRNDGNTEVAKFNIVNHSRGARGIHKNQIGIQKTVLNQPDVPTHDGKPYLEVHTPSVGELIVKDLMLLEGDWSNKEIPRYFKGMKSVGELENNKITIKSNTKNLFDKNSVKKEFIDRNTHDIRPSESGLNRTSDWISCKPNTYYTVSGGDRNRWILKNNKGELTYIGGELGTETPTIKTKSDTVAFRCYVVYRDVDSLDRIQIEEGDTATSYCQYREDKKTITLNEPLRGLPNGVKDKIIKKDGKWFIERNCKNVILNGTETWVNATISPTNIFETPIPDIIAYSGVGQVLCDTFPTGYTNMEIWETYDGIVNLIHRKVLCIRNSKTDTKSDLRVWLQKNPLEVVYQLSKPIYEPLNIDSTVNLYLNTTYISTNSTIPANLKTTVDRVMNRAIEYTDLAKVNPTMENLSLARMWTNLLRDSIKKDELQTELNNNVDLTDLQLERKTTTANLDLYIKSENILQMSLDTNQVTFDDFSSIEDMVKENAVNISINSSLPYQLNAYLPTEIQNADKSNTMDKSILNIKENSESIYQVFANTTDKIVLKDNCSAGNDLVHGVDIKLVGGIAHQKDVYKTTIKFEAEQK